MQSHHFLMLLLAVLAGYAAGRYFPQLSQAVGGP